MYIYIFMLQQCEGNTEREYYFFVQKMWCSHIYIFAGGYFYFSVIILVCLLVCIIFFLSSKLNKDNSED